MKTLTQPVSGSSLSAELHRPQEKINVPPGWHDVCNIGTVDVHKMIMAGEGRQKGFRLDHANQTDPFWFDFKGLQDGAIRDASFFGMGNPDAITLLRFSQNTYSYKLENVFVRAGEAGEETNRGTGIHCLTGRDVFLDHIQTEGHAVGIHIDSMESVLLSKINVERCNVGLKVTNVFDDNHGRGIAINGRVYAEGTKTGLQIAQNCQVKLNDGVKVTDRNVNRAIECHGSQCYLDMTDGSGLTHLTASSFGNEVIVPVGDKVRVIDEGYANRVRTRATPVLVDIRNDFSYQYLIDDDTAQRPVFNFPLLANEIAKFEFEYSVTRQANLKIEFFDRATHERYDFNTRQWTSMAYNRPVPWVTNQQNQIMLEVNTGNQARNVDIRFHVQKAAGLCYNPATESTEFGYVNDVKIWHPIKK